MNAEAQLPKQSEINEALTSILSMNKQGLHIREIESQVATLLNLSDVQRRIPHQGKRTMLGYKLAWARTKLKKDGRLELVKPSVWRLIIE